MARASLFPHRSESRTTIRFMGDMRRSFIVTTAASGSQPVVVTVNEQVLRSIGDMDISETVDRAIWDPSREHVVTNRRGGRRTLAGFAL